MIDEIDYLVECEGVDRIQFIDDNLLPQIAARGVLSETALDWADTLLNGLHTRRQKTSAFGWRGIFRFEDFIRFEESIPNWVNRLEESGCMLLAFGVEHGSEETRKRLKGGSVDNDTIKKVIQNLAQHGIATKGYFIVGGVGENQASTSISINLAIDAGFTLAYFALFKNFRELIRRSNARDGSIEDREKTFMHFRNLLADFDERIQTLETPQDCFEAFGEAYDAGRIRSAKHCVEALTASGFRFQDLFKYNDFHDNLDEVNDAVSVWTQDDNGKITRGFLQAVRRAYFEFYARPAFVERYQWLISRGY